MVAAMSRSERLLELLQVLRRYRQPVSGRTLADELGVSIRTLYRDIASLQAQGAYIEGEPGLGYILRPGFMLPPLMFSEDEIEALVLGSRWVAAHGGDSRLAEAGYNALAKIASVLPADLRESLDANTLFVPMCEPAAAGDTEITAIRQAIRAERKLAITYQAADRGETRRTIWPFAIWYFNRVRLVAAWCELRQDFRNFRTDRIMKLTGSERRYPRRRQALLKEWRAREGIGDLAPEPEDLPLPVQGPL
jgi:predicted DNA-binding transcriptional regulator YafY